MKRFVLPSVVAAIAFCIGMVLGRYALPGTKNSSVTKPSVVASAAVVSPVPLARAPAVAAAEPDHDSEQLPAGASAQAIIAKIKTALLHTGRQRIYTDLNKLSDSIDQHNARAILAFVETLRDNEKSMVLPIVISRWAELDPQAAVAYAQNLPVGSFRNWALTSAISGWAEHDTAAAMAWVDKCRRASNGNKQCRQSFPHWPIKIQSRADFFRKPPTESQTSESLLANFQPLDDDRSARGGATSDANAAGKKSRHRIAGYRFELGEPGSGGGFCMGEYFAGRAGSQQRAAKYFCELGE